MLFKAITAPICAPHILTCLIPGALDTREVSVLVPIFQRGQLRLGEVGYLSRAVSFEFSPGLLPSEPGLSLASIPTSSLPILEEEWLPLLPQGTCHSVSQECSGRREAWLRYLR